MSALRPKSHGSRGRRRMLDETRPEPDPLDVGATGKQSESKPIESGTPSRPRYSSVDRLEAQERGRKKIRNIWLTMGAITLAANALIHIYQEQVVDGINSAINYFKRDRPVVEAPASSGSSEPKSFSMEVNPRNAVLPAGPKHNPGTRMIPANVHTSRSVPPQEQPGETPAPPQANTPRTARIDTPRDVPVGRAPLETPEARPSVSTPSSIGPRASTPTQPTVASKAPLIGRPGSRIEQPEHPVALGPEPVMPTSKPRQTQEPIPDKPTVIASQTRSQMDAPEEKRIPSSLPGTSPKSATPVNPVFEPETSVASVPGVKARWRSDPAQPLGSDPKQQTGKSTTQRRSVPEQPTDTSTKPGTQAGRQVEKPTHSTPPVLGPRAVTPDAPIVEPESGLVRVPGVVTERHVEHPAMVEPEPEQLPVAVKPPKVAPGVERHGGVVKIGDKTLPADSISVIGNWVVVKSNSIMVNDGNVQKVGTTVTLMMPGGQAPKHETTGGPERKIYDDMTLKEVQVAEAKRFTGILDMTVINNPWALDGKNFTIKTGLK